MQLVPTALPPTVSTLTGDIRNLPMEVRALVAALQQGPASAAARNRRRSARHPLLYEIQMHYRDAQGHMQTARACTRDRNDTCIAFLTESHIPAGTQLTLDFTSSADTHVLGRLTCRVRRCRQFHEGWFECVGEAVAEAAPAPPPSTFKRFALWLGEVSGFGPDRPDEATRQRSRAA